MLTWQPFLPVSYTHLDVYKRQGKERLRLMHAMFHMGDDDKFFFDWKWLVESGLSVKDFIAPTDVYKRQRHDRGTGGSERTGRYHECVAGKAVYVSAGCADRL